MCYQARVLSRGLRGAVGSVVTLGVMLASTGTARAELSVERSDGADSCPDTASFAERVRDGAAESTASEITVRFEHTGSGFRSWVLMAGGKRRSLADDAPTCDGLAEATVLAVKLALDLDREPAIAPPAAPPPAETVAAAPAKTETPFAEASATGVLAFGLGTPFASGARAGGALVVAGGRWSIGITGLVLPATTREIGGGTVDTSILGGGIEGCWRLPLGATFLVALCGRTEIMRLEGSAHGFARTEEHASPLVAATLLGRGRVRIAGPAALFVEAGAVLPFVRDRFAIDTVGVVYDPPIVAATTGIGVVVDFE